MGVGEVISIIALVGLSYSRSTMGTLPAKFQSLGKEVMLMQAVDDHGDKPKCGRSLSRSSCTW